MGPMSLDRLPSLLAVLNTIRTSHGIAVPEIADVLEMGRSLAVQRAAQLERAGLVESVGYAPSTGGRAARLLVHRAAVGVVVAGIDISPAGLVVVLCTTDGEPVVTRHAPCDLRQPPGEIAGAAQRLLADTLDDVDSTLVAIGVGLPAPVDFATGLPVSPPVLPQWDRYPLRDELSAAFKVPVDVDNDVNLRLLAELRHNPQTDRAPHVLFMFVAHGVGVGIAVGGQVYRGANGAAGDVGHIKVPNGGVAVCRCGNLGCLEAIVGSEAFTRDGYLLAESGHSPALAAVLAERGEVRALDITIAAESGDPTAAALCARNAHLIGETLSTLVSFFNPHLVILGGAPVRARSLLLEPIRDVVMDTALELTTRDLDIVVTAIQDGAARGAADLALDRLFTRDHAALLDAQDIGA